MKRDFSRNIVSIRGEDYVSFCRLIDNNFVKLNDDNTDIIIFGAGIRGAMIAGFLEERGIGDFSFVDNDPLKWGGTMQGKDILPPEALDCKANNFIIVATEYYKGIVEQLVSLGYRKDTDFVVPRVTAYDEIMKEFMCNDKTDGFIIGCCFFNFISLADHERRSLMDMICESLGEYKIKKLVLHGMPVRLYDFLVRSQLKMGITPKFVIHLLVPFCFNGKSHSLPRAQHIPLVEGIIRDAGLTDRESGEFLGLVKKTYDNFYNDYYLEVGPANNDGVLMDEIARKAQMRTDYLYRINPEDESFAYLKRMLGLYRENDVLPVLLIPPVNYELGNEYFGEQFRERYENNIEYFKSIAAGYGFETLDLSYLLKPGEFASPLSVDEVANNNGREKICAEVCAYLKKKMDSRHEGKE